MVALPLRLIVGLGNPGDEYARTRHNAGFWFVDELAARHGGTWRTDRKVQAEVARITLSGEELWLMKPQAYMNRSGGPVGGLADFYKFTAPQVLVAHDELDLPVGTVRLKEGGGHGGHNGLRDLTARLGDAYWRLRIGIGHPGEKAEVVDYVLTRAPLAEDTQIRQSISLAADVVPLLLSDGPQKAMNRLHTNSKVF